MFWFTVNSGYFPVVIGYLLSLVIYIIAVVEKISVFFIMKSYFGMDGCFNFCSVLSFCGFY